MSGSAAVADARSPPCRASGRAKEIRAGRPSARRARQIRPHLSRVESWACEENLDYIAGRTLIEVRVRGGGRAALRAITDRLAARHIVYAGDDASDFPALAYAAARGRAIFIEQDERETPDIADLWRVSSVEDVCYGFARASSPWFLTPSLRSLLPTWCKQRSMENRRRAMTTRSCRVHGSGRGGSISAILRHNAEGPAPFGASACS